MTFAEFKSFAAKYEASNWRPGQAAFNALNRVQPRLADLIRGGSKDPYYRDDLLPAFWAWVEKHWEDTP